MSHTDRFGFLRSASRLVLAGAAAVLLAGCSSDFSRFGDAGPFQPSARMDRSASSAPAQQVVAAAPLTAVQSAPLSAPVQSAPLDPPVQASAPMRAQAAPAVAAQSAPVRAAPQAVAQPRQAQAAPTVAPAPTVTAVARTEAPRKEAEKKTEPVRTAALAPQTARSDAAPVAPTAAPAAAAPAAAPAAAATSEAASPEFRWPARGRIIQGFKPGQSEGINIAVPEGTAVKAAEGGEVAYAGSELKGYGNLVLIRHPNGFVSAYAHNGELMVKRGETVRRGQVIAKSGQTGNVSSPQLQFQLRKGSTPVDPTRYLAGL